jgi:hypothetical protein
VPLVHDAADGGLRLAGSRFTLTRATLVPLLQIRVLGGAQPGANVRQPSPCSSPNLELSEPSSSKGLIQGAVTDALIAPGGKRR